jgi:DMSO/TMAO reductase YedYZ molybdopterin-dependent catalytic subunit
MNRTQFVAGSAAFAAASRARPSQAAANATVTLPFEPGERALVAFPQKRPLIVLTSRPVQLETPSAVFDEADLTPNDAFFVRWHLPDVPTVVDPTRFRVRVRGAVERPAEFSLDDLTTRFEPVEVDAVLECAGNSRGFSTPRVPGGQWANGAMGNARWRGVRLRDLLAQSSPRTGAIQVRFTGAERPALPVTPQFEKSLPLDVANDPNVILAYGMNGADLPVLNGFPVRLVVPGYYGTYWVKALEDIEVLTEPDENYWMKTAYRVPDTPNYSVAPSDSGFATVPLSKLTVRSFITNFTSGSVLPPGKRLVRGIAFDSGSGIRSVEFSSDGGATWRDAALEPATGPFAFRRWTASFDAQPARKYVLAVRATSTSGEQQVDRWNPGGYARNAVEKLSVSVGA